MKLHHALLCLLTLTACKTTTEHQVLLEAAGPLQLAAQDPIYLPVGEVRFTPDGERSPAALALASELEDASVGLAGPSRFDTAFQHARLLDPIPTPEGVKVFVLRLASGEEELVLSLRYDVDRRWIGGEAHALEPGAEDQEAVALAMQGSAPRRLLSVHFPEDAYEDLLVRMQREGDRQPHLLYHGTLCLLSWDRERYAEPLAELLATRGDAIRSAPGEYPLAFLLLARERFGPELVPAMAQILLGAQRSEPRQLSAALLVLHGERDPLLLTGAREALESPRWEVREAGVKALRAARADPGDDQRILALLGDPQPQVRLATVEAAKEIRLSDEQLPAIAELLDDSSWRIRREAVRAVAKIPGSAATQALITRLSDSDGDVRAAAKVALDARELSPQDLPALTPLLNNSGWTIRRMAVNLIGRIPGEAATRALIPAVDDRDSDVRAAALAQLETRSGRAGTEGLLGLVGDGSGTVRSGARRELSRRSLDAHVAELLELLESKSWKVRQDALDLLGRVQQLDDDALAAVIGAARDPDSDVRKAAWAQLNRRTLGEAQLDDLDQLLKSPSWTVRRGGVRLVAKIPGIEASKRLVEASRDRDADVRQAAFEALRARKDSWATQGLIGMLGNQQGVTDELANRDLNPQLDLLLQMLENESWKARLQAVQMLGRVRLGVAGRAALLERVRDQDADVRKAAMKEARTRAYTAEDLPALELVLQHPGWKVRIFGLELVATIPGDAAEELMLTLKNDRDSDVKDALLRLLAARR